MEMAGLSAFGLTGTFLALVLKKENPQFALLTALATGVLLFLQICSPLGELLDMLRQMAEQAGVAEGYFEGHWHCIPFTVCFAALCRRRRRCCGGEN